MVHTLHSRGGRHAHVSCWGYFHVCKVRQALGVEGLLSIDEAPQVTEVVDLCMHVCCVCVVY